MSTQRSLYSSETQCRARADRVMPVLHEHELALNKRELVREVQDESTGLIVDAFQTES